MKKSPFNTIIWLLVGASALASVWLCYQQITYTRELRVLQRQVVDVNQNRAIISRLVSELYAYSETNNAIKPLLNSLNAQPAQP